MPIYLATPLRVEQKHLDVQQYADSQVKHHTASPAEDVIKIRAFLIFHCCKKIGDY